jgi:uncharacterized protein (DUF983 family)
LPDNLKVKNAHHSVMGVAFKGICPDCGRGGLFKGRLTLADECDHCGLDFTRYSPGDGPASLLILVYGAIIVPMAFLLESLFAPPLWVHVVLWGLVMLGASLLSLRVLKALMVALQYRFQTPES